MKQGQRLLIKIWSSCVCNTSNYYFQSKAEGQSLHQLVLADQAETLDYSTTLPILKSSLLGHLSEYKVELESR